jgi:hypothetical protein
VKLPKSLVTVTPFSKFIALFLFVLFPFAGFYVGMRYQKAADNTVTTSITPIPTVSSQTLITPVVTYSQEAPTLREITPDDNQKTVYVKVGDGILISLGDNDNWNVNVDDPSNILEKSRLMIAEKIGTQGRYSVVKPGTAVISATGTARCAKGQMCPMFAIPFKTTIVATQ